MEVRDLMTWPVRTIPQTATVAEAAALMAQCGVGALPVCEGETLVGMVTDRDLVVQCLARQLRPEEVEVQSIMTRDPVVVEASDPVEQAARLMAQHGLHRVPVVHQGRPIAMLSADDITHFFTDDQVIVELL